jgi:hypothetical protein
MQIKITGLTTRCEEQWRDQLGVMKNEGMQDTFLHKATVVKTNMVGYLLVRTPLLVLRE